MGVACHLDQLRCYANPIAGDSNRSFKDVDHAQLLADFGNFYRSISVYKRRGSGSNAQAVNSNEKIEDFLGKAITVRSAAGSEVTIIDGSALTLGHTSGSVVAFRNGEGADSILEGFTLTNGSGSAVGGGDLGGGVFCDLSYPTIRNNTIIGNTASHGGGIYSDGVIGDSNGCPEKR